MGIRTLLRVAKCGSGLHMKIPPKIAQAFDFESGDTLLVNLIEARYARVREETEVS